MSAGTLRVAPPPFNDPLVEENRFMSSEFFNWLQIVLLPAIEQTPTVFGTTPPLSVTGQTAAIALTALPLGEVTTGVYRVSVYLRITSPDGVSSSVTPQISFPDNGVTCTMTGDALVSDAIDEPGSTVFIASVDAPGPISFGTLYVSNTPNAAVYKAVVLVERVQ